MSSFLRIFSWPRTFGLCLIALFLGKFIVRHILLDANSTIHVGVAMGMLLSRGLLEVYVAWDRRRRRRKTENATGQREAALSLLVRKTIAAVRFGVALSLGCCYWLLRKPSTKPVLSGTPIHYMKNSQYGTVLAIILIAVFADMPISAMLVGAIEHDPERRHVIHVLIAILTLATLIVILGDRWYLQGDYHLIDNRMFYVRVGKRMSADIPVGRIAAIERISGSKADWCKKTGRQTRDVIQISPANIADKPNICLTVGEGPPLRMRNNMFECELPKYVLLYVDEPQALIRAVHANQEIPAEGEV